MGYGFLDIAATPSVKAAQAANGSADQWDGFRGDRDFDRFTDAETAFIAARDNFYMATVSETGWPYVQHRGGPPGFLRVLDERTLGFADYRGNRQYISLGNPQACDRVSLILVDYPAQRRLKLFGHAEARSLAADPALAGQLATPGYRGPAERAFVIHLARFDWNCPQHITPRFTEAELNEALDPVRQRLAALTVENETLRAQLSRVRTTLEETRS
ncbi:pyridoxamine 5'-phosphate oxidase family protein [Lichenihabitans sp. Uapishka_5]|uniref:pyridoxamine 5'-phosphate oxidase family protein n=1 Tax=Lichenihabitans sp. Uapishka_5 TaxID=3037302 RepID=UPI0029E7E298|nr:pyridoxamine 5'-phosphate oxidase family protein [Lichenihabitans sp. Uapishka_5]MDX7951473.1 pyridoxamine 5'-phosphate oxidase family protein [Lichenihabitans sp. Uapishka_5]